MFYSILINKYPFIYNRLFKIMYPMEDLLCTIDPWMSVADPEGGTTVQMHPPSKNPKKIDF